MEIISISFRDKNDESINFKKYFDNDKNGNERE